MTTYTTAADAIRDIADLLGTTSDEAARLWDWLQTTDCVDWTDGDGNAARAGYVIRDGLNLLDEYEGMLRNEAADAR